MKIRDTAADLAELMELPAETMTDAVKLTLTGNRRVVAEHHRGLLGYDSNTVEIGAGRGRVRILGSDLELTAMDSETLIVSGKISGVEYA